MRKEIPILFSTPMVQAILAGWKTHTRRIIKMDDLLENPDRFESAGDSREWDVPRPAIKYDDRIWFAWHPKNSNARTWITRCKYKPGDLLWVRETFVSGCLMEEGSFIYNENGEHIPKVWYKADRDLNNWWNGDSDFPVDNIPWKPSIHMPKNAARIWLEVKNVRAGRLQDISEEDAKAEGVERWIEERMKSKPTHYKVYCDLENPNDPAMYSSSAKYSFETLWHLINGLESWEANPWVWVIEFKVLSTTGKPEFKNIKHIDA